MSDDHNDGELKQTALHGFHVANGGKMVPFAGYDLPVQYPMGVMKEHLHCRASAGLFDVSHMGQAFLIAEDGTYETAAAFFETLVPADISSLEPGQQRYSQLLNEEGGILDDLMISRLAMPGHTHWIYFVVNGACKVADFAHIQAHLPEGLTMRIAEDLSLVALQGPKAADVMARYIPEASNMPFMSGLDTKFELNGKDIYLHISRSGYTGEDGYELAIKHTDIEAVCTDLLAQDEVELIGLGARDSLRLEAGLCLYGHDIDTTTSPIEAGLTWSIQKNRREAGGFLGAERVQRELAERPSRRRVGIQPLGRAPAREGAIIRSNEGTEIGVVTSGGFGPSFEGPVAMGYVKRRFGKAGTNVQLIVRGKEIPAKIVKLPFVPNNFYRG
jgi:aminomethyltransferase